MDKKENIFGRRLYALRKARNLRQEDLAECLNVSRQAISKYELGMREPSFSTLAKIAEYYDISVDYLFGFKDTPLREIDEITLQRYLSLIPVAEKIKANDPTGNEKDTDRNADGEATDAGEKKT